MEVIKIKSESAATILHDFCFNKGFCSLIDLSINLSSQYLLTAFNPDSEEMIILDLEVGSKDRVESLISDFWPNGAMILRGLSYKQYNFSDEVQDRADQESYEKFVYKSVVDEDRVDQVWFKAEPFHSFDCFHSNYLLQLDDDQVNSIVVETGYMHKAIVANLAEMSIERAINHIDKINFAGVNEYSHLLIHSLEYELEVAISDMSKAVRMIFLELARIQVHLVDLTKVFHWIDESVRAEFTFMRQQLVELIDNYSNQHKERHFIRFAGVIGAPAIGWLNDCSEYISATQKRLKKLLSQIKHNSYGIYLKGGGVSSKQALLSGLCGANLRASGVNLDLRKKQNLYFYPELDFRIIRGLEGEIYDRVLVRLLEISESTNIISQLVDSFPEQETNEVSIDDFKDHFKGLAGKQISNSLELSRGQAVLNYCLNEDLSFSHLNLKTPSFSNASAIESIFEGISFHQIGAYLSSFGIDPFERDL